LTFTGRWALQSGSTRLPPSNRRPFYDGACDIMLTEDATLLADCQNVVRSPKGGLPPSEK